MRARPRGSGWLRRITVDDVRLKPAMVGESYHAQLTASGGDPDYQWDVVDGSMPAGLDLDQAGNLSGKPKREGISNFTVEVTDAKQKKSDRHSFSLTVSPELTITRDVSRDMNLPKPPPDFIADFHAEGGYGSRPYTWETVSGAEPPDGISIDAIGRLHGRAQPEFRGTRRFTVKCTDKAGYSDTADFFIKIARRRGLLRWRRSSKDHQVAKSSITVRASVGGILFRSSNYLAVLGLALPAFGAVWIVLYAVATPGGSTLGYLGVGLLTAFACFLIGGLVGFLFGIPRLVSSGDLRHARGPQYSPSTNLAEVSDWLTKLLLGAGLVTLTHLGPPISRLIDNVAHGLAVQSAPLGPAKVMAGAILFGYTAIGMLDGYVMTTMWYQNWIIRHSM